MAPALCEAALRGGGVRWWITKLRGRDLAGGRGAKVQEFTQ